MLDWKLSKVKPVPKSPQYARTISFDHALLDFFHHIKMFSVKSLFCNWFHFSNRTSFLQNLATTLVANEKPLRLTPFRLSFLQIYRLKPFQQFLNWLFPATQTFIADNFFDASSSMRNFCMYSAKIASNDFSLN